MRTNKLYQELLADWNCPSCNRSKIDIVRTLGSGEQIGSAVEHHDHLCDYPNATMRELHGADWVKKIPQGLGEHLNRIEAFTKGFTKKVICEDCNNAETEAKKIVNADCFFSFSPFEIRSFLQIEKHRVHKIKHQEAINVFSKALLNFQLRLKLAQELFNRASDGEYWTLRR